MAESVVIPRRFNGPADNGQGGYVSGVTAGLLDGPAAVSLRSPVPLDRPLTVEREDSRAVRLLDGETLVAEAEPTSGLGLEVPPGVGVEEARQAAKRYRGISGQLFSHCFVCGLDRADSQHVFAGAVEGRELVATPWTPPAWTAGEDGAVQPEIVAGVLDCPTYFAAYPDETPVAFLARFAFSVDAPVAVEEEHVVIGWPLEVDGRKRRAGSAVLSADGEVLGRAEALMIEPRTEP